MVSNSESFFQRTLQHKTIQARDAVQECVFTFLSTLSADSRQRAAQKALDAVGRVVDMLNPQDRPPWLTQLYASLKIAHSNNSDQQGVANMQRIASEFQRDLNHHQWRFSEIDVADGFDFDAVYNKYKAENRIPELFDEIISAFNEIIASGEIDSVRALEELRRILATLQNAKNGSYFATRNAWFFVANWFKNTGWELLGEIPVLGAAVRGLRKSLEDMNDGMQDLHEQIQEELQAQLSKDFPPLEYHSPELLRIEHRQSAQDEEST